MTNRENIGGRAHDLFSDTIDDLKREMSMMPPQLPPNRLG